MRKLFLGILLIAFTVQCRKSETKSNKKALLQHTQQSSVLPISATYDAFGIDVNGFNVRDFRIKKNESLYLMLQKLNLSQAQIYHAIQKAQKVLDVRSLRPKQIYRAYVSKDGNKLEKMVWEPNKVDFVTFDWQQDSLQIYRASRAISKKTEQISGEITSSLYNAISDKQSRDKLVYKMSEIFAWQVDFFNLRKGDTFKILFEKKYVDNEYYDMGAVKAIELSHMGDTYFAYKFQEGDFDGYYDEQGRSVQKALLKTPFVYDQRISSSFNPHRFHPILKRRVPHNGIDYAAPYGTNVLAVGDGTVTRAGYAGAAGRMIKIKHNGRYETGYMHLKGYAKGIRAGTHVKQGEVIGYVGHSGRVTGTHLHYSMYINGKPVNPAKVDLPASKSISKEYMPEFKRVRDALNTKLYKEEIPAVATSAAIQ